MEKNQYVSILIDSLLQKQTILKEILRLNEEQGKLIKQDAFDLEAFDRIVTEKAIRIEKLESLDDGFEMIYEKTKSDLVQEREHYKLEIKEMQDLIARVTDLSMRIQASEERNKAGIEAYFKNTRATYQQARATTKAASAYYSAMSRLNTVDPQLLDQKK